MSLGRYAPTMCLLVALACAASALSNAFRGGGIYPGEELSPGGLIYGLILTMAALALTAWLILDTRDFWAKAALALLLVGPALWFWTIWPAFWASLGYDDCWNDCMRLPHMVAWADVRQGKWAVAAINIASALCVFIALYRRQTRSISRASRD